MNNLNIYKITKKKIFWEARVMDSYRVNKMMDNKSILLTVPYLPKKHKPSMNRAISVYPQHKEAVQKNTIEEKCSTSSHLSLDLPTLLYSTLSQHSQKQSENTTVAQPATSICTTCS